MALLCSPAADVSASLFVFSTLMTHEWTCILGGPEEGIMELWRVDRNQQSAPMGRVRLACDFRLAEIRAVDLPLAT